MICNVCMKKKVLLVIGSASIGGAEKQLVQLAKRLNGTEFECRVLFLASGGTLEEFLHTHKINFEIADFKNHSKIYNLFKSIRLIVRYSKEGFKIFYIFLPQAILYFGKLTRLLNKEIVIVYGVRGSIYLKNSLLYKLYRQELIKADLLICNSKFLKSEISTLKRIKMDKVVVIYNGVEIQAPKIIKKNLANHPVNGIVVANFKEYKGHDLLIGALKEVNQVKLHLTFAGGGEHFDRVKEMSRSVPIHTFTFLGQSNNFTSFFKGQDFAIHPSKTESLSNAILEELAYSLPVVCFDVGGNKELVTDFQNGFIVEPYNIREFARIITTLCQDRSLLESMSIEARKSVLKFDWELNIEHHKSILHKALIRSLD